jgi:hypothetical protein
VSCLQCVDFTRTDELGIVRRGMCEWEDERPVCGDALNSVHSLPERYGSDSMDSHVDEIYVVQELIYVHLCVLGS